MVSGLSIDELPNDECVVVYTEGLSINGHIDPLHKEVGHMCVIGVNISQKRFFDWFNDNVTYPAIKFTRKKFYPFSAGGAQEGQIPIDQEVCI